MHILFLDDDPTRTAKALRALIGHNVYAVSTSKDAIDALSGETRFDLVSLDHDLGGGQMLESTEESGYAVAQFIAGMREDRLPRSVIIHSFNPLGAGWMLLCLSTRIESTRIAGPRPLDMKVYRALFDSVPYWHIVSSHAGCID